MCGISAVVSLDDAVLGCKEDRTKLANDLDSSLHHIKHRGPDSNGKWISSDNRIALGFVRLSVNDLSSAGEQPFINDEETIFAVVNGEIYNSDDLKANLPAPYNFKGKSDCEIVIPLYLQYGHSFISKLRGEFALCLYDARSQNFIAARDRHGVKPLYWTVVDHRLLVASEIKAFLPLGLRPEWDVKSIIEEGWVSDNRTIFKGVQKIRPGHNLISRGFGSIEQRQYWETEFPDKQVVDLRSEEEIIQSVRKHLLDAIRIRLKADVPVALYLSGGIDSSAVAGVVQHLIEKENVGIGTNSLDTRHSKITAFCVEFEGSNFNEAPIAERTAEFLGINLEKLLMTEQMYVDHLESSCWHSEHHNPDLNSTAKTALNKQIRKKGFRVVLGGEGADEHFAGYSLFEPDFFREPDKTWPVSQWDDSARTLALKAREKGIMAIYQSNKITEREDSAVARTALNGASIAFNMAWYTNVKFAPWTKCHAPVSTQDNLVNTIDGRVLDLIKSRWHPLHTAQYVWAKSSLAGVILTCAGDRAEMAHGIEGRPPLLDHVFTEYANGIPPALKIKKSESGGEVVEKWVWREAVKPFVTEELYKRKKHPFTAPVTFLEQGPLHRYLNSLITKDNVDRLGWVDWDDAKGLTKAAFGTEKNQLAARKSFVIAQWVILSKRFGVKTARGLEIPAL